MTSVLRGPRLKVERANKHIDEVESIIDTFAKSDFYRLEVQHDERSGDNVLEFQQIKRPPDQLPCVIGDAVHNLRSALDLAMCDLLIELGIEITRYTRFWFFDDRDQLVSKLSKGVLKGFDDCIEFLADLPAAYRTTDNPIHALHSLDIDDKHILLIPHFEVAKCVAHDVVLTGNNKIGQLQMTVGKGGVLKPIGFPAASQLQINGNIDATIHVVFGENQSLEGQPVVPTLRQLSQAVAEILDLMAAFVFSGAE